MALLHPPRQWLAALCRVYHLVVVASRGMDYQLTDWYCWHSRLFQHLGNVSKAKTLRIGDEEAVQPTAIALEAEPPALTAAPAVAKSAAAAAADTATTRSDKTSLDTDILDRLVECNVSYRTLACSKFRFFPNGVV